MVVLQDTRRPKVDKFLELLDKITNDKRLFILAIVCIACFTVCCVSCHRLLSESDKYRYEWRQERDKHLYKHFWGDDNDNARESD